MKPEVGLERSDASITTGVPLDVGATSSEIEAWGELWLQSYIDDGSAEDLENRRFVAKGWREWSLETWLHWARWEYLTHQGVTMDAFYARLEAYNNATLYQRQANGLLIWRSYTEFRSRGLPVDEPILAKLDEWADALERAHTSEEVAAAIEMSPHGYKQSARRHLDAVEKSRGVASEVAYALQRGDSPMVAYRRVANRLGLKVDAVKATWLRWNKGPKSRSTTRRIKKPKINSVFDWGQKLT